jgi:hypothetical protein
VPDFNDVVRHVILRILVDQTGLAEDIAKAKEKLKALDDAGKESDKNRIKSAEDVAKAYERQKDAIDDNRRAVEDHQAAVNRDAGNAKDRLDQSTKQAAANTKAQTDSINKIQEADDKAHRRNLDQYKAQAQAERDLEKVRIDAADRASREQQKLNQQLASKQHEINDSEFLRDASQPNRLQGLLDEISQASKQLKAQTDSSQHDARHRGSLADAAASDASLAKTAALAAQDGRSADAVDRRSRSLQTERRSRQELANLAQQGNVLEQRALEIVERRAKTEASSAKAAQTRQQGLGAFFKSLGNVASDTAVLGGRSVVSAPSAARRAGQDVEKQFQQRRGLQDFGQSSFKDLEKEVTRGEAIVGNFFHAFGRDAEDGVLAVRKMRAEVTAFFGDLNRARGSGGGGGAKLFTDLFQSAIGLGEALDFKLGGLAKHFASMESIIVAVVAALGPLAAILGAVGAAALGVASNVVALSGALFALPGILTAVISGFGVLALVLKPLTGLLSSYESAMKTSAATATQAKDAALDYKQALLQQKQSETDYHRTQQDGILLQRRVDDARKEAKRNVEDYQESLKKLAFDEEGAQLDVDQALQNYKRTLADPTASALDRRQAQHDYQGALENQYDTQKQGKRTQEDAKEAISQGVEGNEQVISAERALADQTNNLQLAYIAWQKAILAAQKALNTKSAGGNTQLADYQAQLKKLPADTQKVALAIVDLIKPGGAFEKMRNRLSEKIFGPISSDTGKFKDVLGDLEKLLSPVADAIGGIAKQALAWLSSPDWKAFFERTGKNSAVILQQMATAAFSIADGIKNIVDAATPFTNWLVGAVAGVAKEFGNWSKSTSGKNAVVSFLDNTERRIKEIWPIIKDFAAGFAGFFEALNAPSKAGAGDDFTSKFNKGLAGMAKTFRDLGEEAAKPNSGFRKWLGEVGPLLKNIVHFLGQVGTFFGGLFSDKRNITEAKNILKEIGTKWLPTLVSVFGQLASSGLISKLGEYISNIFVAVDKFLKAGGLDSLKIVLDDVVQAGKILNGLVSAFTALPGVLKIVGASIAAVFGLALLTQLSGISLVLKGLFGLFKGIAGVVRDVRVPKVDTSTEPSTGSSGKKPGIVSRIRNRNKPLEDPGAPNLNRPTSSRGTDARNTTEPQTGTRNSGGGLVNRTGENQPTSRYRRIVNTANTNLKDSLTGASDPTSVIKRIEEYTRLIEINTRRRGSTGGTGGSGTTEPRGGGSGGGGGRPSDPTKPTGTGGKTGRPSYTGGGATAFPTRDSIRDQIDPYGNSTRSQRTTGLGRTYEYSSAQTETNRKRQDIGLGPVTPSTSYKPGTLSEDSPRRQATTTGYSPERQAANERRKKAKLSPLPPDIGTDSRTTAVTGNTDVGAADPNAVHNFPVTAGGPTDKDNRYRQVENARRSRTGLPPLRPDEPAPRPTPTANKNLPYQQQQRLNNVVQSQTERRHVPSFDGNGQPGQRPDVSIAPIEETPGTGRAVQPRDPKTGRFLPKSPAQQASSSAPVRNAKGQFTKPEPEPTSRRDRRRRALEQAQYSPPSDLDEGVEIGGVPEEKPSKKRRALNRLFPSDDSGSVGLGIGTRDDDIDDGTARSRKNRTTKKPSRGGKVKGLLGGLFGGLTGASAGEDPEYDEGYEAGYADAVGGSGGSNGPGRGEGKKGRRGKGGAASAVEGELEDEFGGTKGRRSKSLGSVEGFVESEAEENLGRGGKGLLGKLGGGLGKGLGAGLAGAAISGGLELGGDALIDKFVKNDKDKGSLTRAVGAVSNGASIGSTIGGFLGPGGALIGGALGGVAGGIYSLFKDKNLRDFVEKKLANVGHIIADGFKSALDGVGRFFKFLKDGWKQAFDIVGHFFADVGKSIGHFFEGIGKWAAQAATTVVGLFLDFLKFWYVTLPLTVLKFLFVTLPGYAVKAVVGLVTIFLDFLKFWYITLPLTILKFFFVTLPGYAAKAIGFLLKGFAQFLHFWFVDLPNKVEDFFIKHLPASLGKGLAFFKSIFFDPIANFFGNTIPNFFTKDIPNAISKIGPFLKNALIGPFQHFFDLMKKHDFGYWLTHPGDFFSSLKDAFIDRKMSGGLIKGVYQGVEDKALSWVTPGEMVIRRSKTQEPGAKMFLQDFNERGMEALYSGLSASTKPQVMSMVAPEAQGLTGRVPTVVNNTVNHAPVMGDVTINNPVREKSEYSLRRQVQLAAIRHRR